MCPSCDPYETVVDIHGPAQLRRIVEKIQTAIRRNLLLADNLQSQSDDPLQPPFMELELSGSAPDHIYYRFHCTSCAKQYELYCELYHGAGGRWQPADPEG